MNNKGAWNVFWLAMAALTLGLVAREIATPIAFQMFDTGNTILRAEIYGLLAYLGDGVAVFSFITLLRLHGLTVRLERFDFHDPEGGAP